MIILKLMLLRMFARVFGNMATPGSRIGGIIAVAAVSIGYFVYRHHKKKKAREMES